MYMPSFQEMRERMEKIVVDAGGSIDLEVGGKSVNRNGAPYVVFSIGGPVPDGAAVPFKVTESGLHAMVETFMREFAAHVAERGAKTLYWRRFPEISSHMGSFFKTYANDVDVVNRIAEVLVERQLYYITCRFVYC